MTMTISGSGTITGLSAGGLPDATITQAELSTNVAGNGPAFYVTQSATSALTGATWNKVTFTSETFDTNNNYDTSTSRFTPTVAGYYQLNAVVTSASIVIQVTALYKNGSQQVRGPFSNNSAVSGSSVSGLIYMNGSTDYVEVYCYNGGSTTTTDGNTNLSFNGFLARAA